MEDQESQTTNHLGYLELTSGNYKYKFGIIDFLTNYDALKLAENTFKSKLAKVDKNEISAIDADTYQSRFMNYMKEYI